MPNDSKLHIKTECAVFFRIIKKQRRIKSKGRKKKTVKDKIPLSRSKQFIFIESG